MITPLELLKLAEARRDDIVQRRERVENDGKPLLDIEWQFMSGMIQGANEVVRVLVRALLDEATKSEAS